MERITITYEEIVDGKKVNFTNNATVDKNFYLKLSKSVEQRAENKTFTRGMVKFDKNKLIVNPYFTFDNQGNSVKEGIYFYTLKNRQTIKLRFQEINVSALIIPIKYRFKDKGDIPEEFSTAINGNVFVGYSWGVTSFFHQEEMDNKVNTWKITGGFLFGVSSVKLNSSNTSRSLAPLAEGVELTKGLATIGIGSTYSFNKINIGVFGGIDYAVGDYAEKWNYNKEPWIGLAVGYSLL